MATSDVFAARPPVMPRPPRPPSSTACSAPKMQLGRAAPTALPRPEEFSPTKLKKRPPTLAGPEVPEEKASGAPPCQSFSMATPKNEVVDASRHYIGTPRAGSILSAFLDFDDADLAGQADGPPLDFDEAMSAFQERQEAALEDAQQIPPEAEALCKRLGSDECGSSGSTWCPSEGEGSPSSPHAAASSDEESDVEERDEEEYYESDFETDSGSEYEESETEEAPGAEQPAAQPGTEQAAVAGRRAASRGALRKPGSRAGSRAGSRTRGPGGRDSSLAGRGRRREASRGAVERLKSLDRVLTMLSAQ